MTRTGCSSTVLGASLPVVWVISALFKSLIMFAYFSEYGSTLLQQVCQMLSCPFRSVVFENESNCFHMIGLLPIILSCLTRVSIILRMSAD
jgi:hypothetical protein